MSIIKSIADVSNDRGGLSRFEKSVFATKSAELLAVNKFHGDEKIATLFHHIIDGDDIGV